MPIITTAMCNSYKRELFEGVHNHRLAGGNTFHMALYTDNPASTLDKNTTSYTSQHEVIGGGYSAGGQAMINIDPALDGDVAHTQFQNPTWSSSTITARGCMVYNLTAGGNSVSVHDFGQNFSSSNGDFTVLMPTNDGTTALLRLV